MQVVGFQVKAVDRFAGIDVAGRLDGGDGGVVVEDFEGDRVVVLLRVGRPRSRVSRAPERKKESQGGEAGEETSLPPRLKSKTHALVVPRIVEFDQVARGELFPRHGICAMLPQEGDDGEQLVHGAVLGADGSLERFQGEGAVVEREFGEDGVFRLGAAGRGRVLTECARVLGLFRRRVVSVAP